jgi:hypothetical protein
VRNVPVLIKVFVPIIGLVAILTIRHAAQIAGPGSSSAQAGDGPVKQQTNAVPSCSGDLPAPVSPPGSSKRHSVTLSWNASVPVSGSPQDAIQGYYVYRSQISQTYHDTDRITSLPLIGTQCLDATVQSRTTYYYVVRAVAKSGAQSAASGEIKAVIPFP